MEGKLKEMKKKCPQFIKVDLYSAGQCLILIAFILFCLYVWKKESSYVKASFLTFATGAVCLPTQFFFGKAKVNNKSGSDIEYLEEGGGENRPVYILGSGERRYDIDGVKHNEFVYKIPDGIHVTINKNGKLVPHSIFGKVIYHVEGGVKETPPDATWNALFPEEKWV